MIIIIGWAKLREGSIEEGLDLGRGHSRRSRSELGCLSHRCFIDAEDSSRIMFHEEWADTEAVARHFALAESREFLSRISALAEDKPEIKIYESRQLDPRTI